MEITEWIDENLKVFIDGKCSFMLACSRIAMHEKLSLVNMNNQRATFEISSLFKTKIIVENSLDSNDYTLEYVLEEVSCASGISIDTLKKRTRKREIVEARYAYFLTVLKLNELEKTNYSLQSIGDIVHLDHCTVLHSKTLSHLPSIQKIIDKTNISLA
jgi:chromosomal replication initiation ATPase DnaA